jgi:hypothetical protein
MFARYLLTITCAIAVVLAGLPTICVAQEKFELLETFRQDAPVRVELNTTLVGRLALPDRKNERGGKPEVVAVQGIAKLLYDEVLLPRNPDKNLVALRQYTEVAFERRLGDNDQKAEVRPAVRRMVVLRSEAGKKVPFSPDGPLTLAEIDVVRTDLFAPVLVTGILPAPSVVVGNRWKASDQAVIELTDYDLVEKNELVVTLAAIVTLDGRKHAKLTLAGSVRGTTEDGASIQTFTGTAYFDLERKMLVYLNLAAKNQLLGPDGKTINGEVTGTYIVKRSPAIKSMITTDMIQKLDTKPTEERTQLLYEDATVGLKLTYPRRWRLSITDGRTLTLEEASGDVTLAISRQSPKEPMTADRAVTDAKAFVARQKWQLLDQTAPTTTTPGITRFTVKVQDGPDKSRIEYAILTQPEGTALATARIRDKAPAELTSQVENLFKAIQLVK